mmetsp:Transcript_2415/g.5505  ORF Transcript_2415/g.5505 Transcript_2415/m.5505 type:complete len:85 (-) Transcript_2415:966-1220(-)
MRRHEGHKLFSVRHHLQVAETLMLGAAVNYLSAEISKLRESPKAAEPPSCVLAMHPGYPGLRSVCEAPWRLQGDVLSSSTSCAK